MNHETTPAAPTPAPRDPYAVARDHAISLRRAATDACETLIDATIGEGDDARVIAAALRAARAALRLIEAMDARSFEANDLDAALETVEALVD